MRKIWLFAGISLVVLFVVIGGAMKEMDDAVNSDKQKIDEESLAKAETATFAAGCFWGVEAAFRELLGKGVLVTQVGYTGGKVPNPTYEQVCTKKTGHFEAVEIKYDPEEISYQELLKVFWNSHNPRRSDGQGPDIGSQYRAAVFYHNAEQKKLAEESKAELERTKYGGDKVATLILKAKEFYSAEEYHQQYYEKAGVKGTCPVY